MPKVTWNIPAAEKELAAELRELWGGYMSVTNIQAELGFKKWSSADAWAADIPATMVNGRRRYRVTAVAHKLYESTREAVNS